MSEIETEILVSPAGETDELEGKQLYDRLGLLWNQRQFIFQVTVLGLILTTVIAFMIPKRYESTVRLMPPDSQSSSGMAMLASLSNKVGGGLGAYAGSLLGAQSSGALFLGILDSRTLQERVINRFDLKRVYKIRFMEDARKRLSANTAISEDRKSGIITITVSDSNPKLAAAIGQAYVEELNWLVAELSTSAAHRERVFLEERLKTVQRDLQAAEGDFSQFASKNAAIDLKEQGKAMVGAAATLQGELIGAQSELEGLRQTYNDNNVRVRTMRARIAELRAQLEKLGGKPNSTDSPKSGSGREREGIYPAIRDLPLLGVPYADKYRRTKIQETLYEILTQQYELAKVQEARDIPSVKVLDPAIVPEKKSSPPRLMIMIAGTCLAFVFSLLWITGFDLWKDVAPDHPARLLLQKVCGRNDSSLTPSSNGRFRNLMGILRKRSREKE